MDFSSENPLNDLFDVLVSEYSLNQKALKTLYSIASDSQANAALLEKLIDKVLILLTSEDLDECSAAIYILHAIAENLQANSASLERLIDPLLDLLNFKGNLHSERFLCETLNTLGQIAIRLEATNDIAFYRIKQAIEESWVKDQNSDVFSTLSNLNLVQDCHDLFSAPAAQSIGIHERNTQGFFTQNSKMTHELPPVSDINLDGAASNATKPRPNGAS